VKKIYWLTLVTVVTVWSQEKTLGDLYKDRDYSIIGKNVSIVDKITKESTTKPLTHWRKFSKSDYKNSDYTLRKDIDYFELRKYLFDTKTGKQATRKYIPYLPIYRKKLSFYPRKIVHQFQNMPFDKQKSKNMGIEDPGSSDYIFKIYGFIIKKDNKFWTINEKKDLVWLFDKIDTDAELYQFLQLNNIAGDAYRKTSTGYDVKQNKIEYKVKQTKGDVDKYTEYELHRTYIYHVQSNGEVSKELISSQRKNKKKSVWDSSIEGDCILPPLPTPLKVILKDKQFVTPSSY